MDYQEFQNYRKSNENTLPLNYILCDIKKVEKNNIVLKTTSVKKLHTNRYYLQKFYKTISKMYRFETSK